MKQTLIPMIILLVCLLSACKKPSAPPVTTVATTAATEVTTMPTPPPHSSLYHPEFSIEEVITYFNEVCLDAEFINSGDPCKLQKWEEPISFILNGNYTDEDFQTITDFTNWLNSVEGFPGIEETTNPNQANLQIFFRDTQGLVDLMGDHFSDCDGAVTFWYQEDMIYDAIICYSTEVSQTVRNSVILEELYNGLGPVQDTDLRPDSIIYAGYSEPQALTAMDELILRLLYHPDMKCGMDAAACEAVIRSLYY